MGPVSPRGRPGPPSPSLPAGLAQAGHVATHGGFAQHVAADPAQLKGGDGTQNAKALRAVLEGEKNAYRDIALLNAAGALVVAGKAADLKQGVALAAESIDSGRALATLEKLVEVSNRGS